MQSSPIPSRRDGIGGWLVLALGLAVYIAVQGYLVWGPLWTRDLPPEVDDSLAFLVRTQEMEECFFQDCPALEDLRQQFQEQTTDPRVIRQRALATFPFPFYHPLFSAVLLGLKRLGPDLIWSYKVLWSLAPPFFGVAFAFLLSVFWDRTVAGATLALLAFKVFPCTGLHYLTPSNLATGMAVLLWARILQRQGDALWALLIGALLLPPIHPVGAVHLVIAMLLALSIAEPQKRGRVWRVAIGIGGVGLVGAFVLSFVGRPQILNVFSGMAALPSLKQVAEAYGFNVVGAAAAMVNLKEGLFGPFFVFLPAVVLGILLMPSRDRRGLMRFLIISVLVLIASLYHTHPVSPEGDLFFRLWIPMVVVLVGATGHAFVFTLSESVRRLKSFAGTAVQGLSRNVERLWPLFVCAALVGYGMETALSGAEIVEATRQYMQDRQPLSLDRKQVERMLAESKPGDRVLYTSTISMAFYFIHGAMQRGAVYYHPAFEGTSVEMEWLRRPKLKFAVGYNPTVYHPAYEGLDEKDRCISLPEFRYSPLGRRRKHHPVAREGWIPAWEYRWIQLEATEQPRSASLRVLIRNPGGAGELSLVSRSSNEKKETWSDEVARVVIHQNWTGWLEMPTRNRENDDNSKSFRLVPTSGLDRYSIGGVVFGEDPLNWPWRQKARLILKSRVPGEDEMEVTFDPCALLPCGKGTGDFQLLHDGGSSVLFVTGQ